VASQSLTSESNNFFYIFKNEGEGIPLHISGFFEICERDNPLLKGSVGCGILLSAGCFTELRVCACEETEIHIRIF